MTITRRWQTGLESGSLKEFDYWNTSTVLEISSATKKTGTYSIRFYIEWTSAHHAYAENNVSGTKQIRLGGFVYSTIPHANYREIIQVRSASGVLVGLRLYSDTNLKLYVGGVLRDTYSSYSASTWQHFGIDTKIDSVSGWAKVYRDGIEILSYAGNTGTADITKLRIGAPISIAASMDAYWDNVYIDDTTGEGSATAPPILQFYPITADGNGNYAQWDGSDGNSTDNYLLIDERPPVTTDYVETNVTDEYDSYTMTSVSLGTGQAIEAVIPLVYAKRYGSTEKLALGTRLSSTDLIGSDQIPGASESYFWERQTTKPGGGSWGQSDLDAVEVVLKSRGTY